MTGGRVYFDTATGIISSTDVTDQAAVVIPATLGGAQVKVIGAGAFSGKNMRSVILPEGLLTISQNAFQNCTLLKSVSLPKSLDSIGDYAFRYDEALSEVTLDGKPFDPNDYSTVRVGYLAFTDTLLVRPDFSPAYKTGEWYKKLTEIQPTGNCNYLNDLFAVAESQMGYHEGDWLAEQDGYTKKRGDYAEYNYWWGEQGSKWCGEYVAWCIAMASIPEEIFKYKYTTDPTYKWAQTTYAGGSDCSLKKGDVILFKYDGGNHVVLVEKVSESNGVVTVDTINGNHSNDVSKDTYTINASTGKTINEWSSING